LSIFFFNGSIANVYIELPVSLFLEKARQSWTAGWRYPPDSGPAQGSVFGYQRMPSSTSASGNEDIRLKSSVVHSMDDVRLEKGKNKGAKFASSQVRKLVQRMRSRDDKIAY